MNSGTPKKRRRASTKPPAGSDPHPADSNFVGVATEDTAQSWGDKADSNDQRLLADRPPHWADRAEEEPK